MEQASEVLKESVGWVVWSTEYLRLRGLNRVKTMLQLDLDSRSKSLG